MRAIYKKELKQYFHSMIGFVFLAFFIAIISIYTWANNFYGKVGNFEATLSSSTFLFVLLIPILTMRVIAEEKHQKTDQLLYTAPISIGRVIIGKYLALLTLFGIGVLFVGLYPLILKQIFLPYIYLSIHLNLMFRKHYFLLPLEDYPPLMEHAYEQLH